MNQHLDPEQQLIDLVAECYADPLRYTMLAFPWGQAGTTLHRHEEGPDQWTRDLFDHVSNSILENVERRRRGDPIHPIRCAIASGHGIGKANEVNMLTPTPSGMRRWGDIQPGDFVFGRDGKPTRVLATHPQGKLPLFRVTFDDRSSTLVSAQHLWTVRGRSGRRTGAAWDTLSTEEIIDRGVTRANGAARARQWELPLTGPVEFEDQGGRPVEPYTLGVWLGDGARAQGSYSKPDREVAEAVAAEGYVVSERAGGNAHGVYGLVIGLREAGVADNYSFEKFVPEAYKVAPAEVRAEVLRGLLDTDGECAAHGSVVFSSTSKTLAEDVVWLARSLGGKARLQPSVKMPSYPGPNGERLAGRPCWRATLTMPKGYRVFNIERKQARVRQVEDRYLARWISSIEPAGEGECMCITVEADDHLYLANDFIPTHNSATVSWLIHWLMSTRVNCRGIVTAGTENQLSTRLWPELAKWRAMAINRHWFEWTATRFSYAPYPEERRKNYCFDAIPWSDHNSEAFAGLHNESSAVCYIFDEASGVADKISEVASGGLTDGEPFWFKFGNPTKSSGDFYDCFHKNRKYWWTKNVDSRTVRVTNKAYLSELIEQFGPNSPEAQVRVYGEFPDFSATQFIGTATVDEAIRRELVKDPKQPKILGVDVARFGTDHSVLYLRQGDDARSVPPLVFSKLDLMETAARVAEFASIHNPDHILVDGVGVGGGVVDRLKMLGFRVIEVNAGAKANDSRRYVNKATELWGEMRKWLEARGAIPANQVLKTDLISREYRYSDKLQIRLETKDEMKRRGQGSPDVADALALTFAVKTATKDLASARAGMFSRRGRVAEGVEYSILS